MAIVTPADRPKSVHNRCVIEVFGGVLCVVTLLFGLFCRCNGFCHRAESDSLPFPLVYIRHLYTSHYCEVSAGVHVHMNMDMQTYLRRTVGMWKLMRMHIIS